MFCDQAIAQHYNKDDTCARLTISDFKVHPEFYEFRLNCTNTCDSELIYYKPILDLNECFLLRLYIVLDKFIGLPNRDYNDSIFVKSYPEADYDFPRDFVNLKSSVILYKDETFSKILRLESGIINENFDRSINYKTNQEQGTLSIVLDYTFLKNKFYMKQKIIIKRKFLENNIIVYDFEFIK